MFEVTETFCRKVLKKTHLFCMKRAYFFAKRPRNVNVKTPLQLTKASFFSF